MFVWWWMMGCSLSGGGRYCAISGVIIASNSEAVHLFISILLNTPISSCSSNVLSNLRW